MPTRGRWWMATAAPCVLVLPLMATESLPEITVWPVNRLAGPPRTVQERVTEFGPQVRSRLQREFDAAGVPYPPRELAFLAFKDVRHLEVYARQSRDEAWRFVKDYRVLGASGTLGPKLMEGDNQVPEGLYRVDSLNPNSQYHLSIRLNYPNAFDREIAQREGRTNLGGAIMIHGGRYSMGCLAVGDPAAEELFVLTALTGERNVRIIISPTDFRDRSSRVPTIVVPWLRELYLHLRTELQRYPLPAALE